MKIDLKIIIHLFCICFATHCFASDSVTVKYLGIDQGLSNNAVTCIYQDHHGFMWFGTYDGLNRYDGYSFRVFRNIIGDSNSLVDNHIYCISSDNENRIWVGGAKGASIYDPTRSVFFTPRFSKPNNSALFSLHEDALAIKNIGQAMLVGTARNGLVVFADAKKAGKQIILPGKADTGYGVSAIEFDSIRHEVWVFVNDYGLFKYDINTEKLYKIATGITQCIALFAKSNGDLLIGNDLGVFKLSKNSFIRFEQIPEMSVRAIAENAQHGLWIATDGSGLWQLPPDANRAQPLNLDGQIINSNSIYDLFIDQQGREWIGTLRGGVNILEKNNSLFKTISYHKGRTEDVNDFILSFCEDDKSNLWIGTDGAGLRYWNRQENSFTKYVHSTDSGSISSNFITYLTKDYKNDLWISTWFGGIAKLNKANNTFKRYTCYNSIEKRNERNIWQIYEDSQKRLWACASNKGCLYLYNRAADRFELFDQSLTDFQVLTEDKAGNLWGGNYNSIVLVDPNKKNHKVFFIGYPVRSIQEDKNHNFWIGTEGGGLLLFDRQKGTYQRISTKEGLPNNAVLRILEDDKGNLWLSTYYGLCRFNPILKTFRNYNQAEGLQSNQFSFNAAMISKSGEFLFGGIKGFNIFYPDSIYCRKDIPHLFLTGLKIDNTPIEAETDCVAARDKDIITRISIPFYKAMLSLDFAALQYSNASNLRYAYFLKGWDKEWDVVDNVRTANYSHLKEGEYKFYVKVMNANGFWNKEVELLSITVLPPWYRTWWAYILYASFVMGAIYTVLYYYRRQERLRYEVRLALLEKQKEKELTERKIDFFTHISHEFRTPLTLIVNPLKELVAEVAGEKAIKKIMTVQRNARRLLSLVDQLLMFRKAESIDRQLQLTRFDMSEVCNEVFLSFFQLAASKNINFIFHKPIKEIEFCGDKEKIEIILFNLISNALKYTPPDGRVELTILEEESQLLITVSDTGCGIAGDIDGRLFDAFYQANNTAKSSQAGFGIGLHVSQKLAMAHGGELCYTSREGLGTIFTLSLSRSKDGLREPAIEKQIGSRESIIHELVEDIQPDDSGHCSLVQNNKSNVIDKIISGLPTMLIVDDSIELRNYIRDIFSAQFNIYEAEDGVPAFDLISRLMPDIVISDLVMTNMDGIELCQKLKASAGLAHIPIILLTGSSSEQSKIKGIECGAEDYLNKPFSRELIVARVQNILRSRNRLQQYFFNTITLQPTSGIDADNKEFLESCMEIVESHMEDPEFTVQIFCREIGMSHPALYKKIKAVSGLTVNVFIRYLRLRKAAELLINTSKTIVEVTYITGFNDVKYFREQFSKLFGLNPSDYVKRYRKPFGNKMVRKGT